MEDRVLVRWENRSAGNMTTRGVRDLYYNMLTESEVWQLYTFYKADFDLFEYEVDPKYLIKYYKEKEEWVVIKVDIWTRLCLWCFPYYLCSLCSFIHSSFIIHTIKRSKYTIRILLEVGESDKGLDVSGPLGFISASYWVILIKSARFSFHDFQTIIHSAKYGVHGPPSILNQV